jgi:hypothetical protein
MRRRRRASLRSMVPRRVRRRGLLGLPAALLGATAAMAAGSPPTPGGHYVGSTSQKLAINVRVSGNGSEFQGGRIHFRLQGTCRVRRYLDLSPTPPPAVKINSSGHFSIKGTFGPTSSFHYTSKVVFRGQFSNHGKVLMGSARYSASNAHASCTSGRVTFRATRV